MFISFGYLTKKCILFIVVPLAMFLRVILPHLKEENNMFYYGFLRFLGRALNGFLWVKYEKNLVSNKLNRQYNKETKLVDPDQNVLTQDYQDTLCKDESNQRNNFLVNLNLIIMKKEQ